MHGRVLQYLLYLMRTSDKEDQQRIAVALAHLCSDDDQVCFLFHLLYLFETLSSCVREHSPLTFSHSVWYSSSKMDWRFYLKC